MKISKHTSKIALAAVLAALGTGASQAMTIIIDDDVEGNGDAAAAIGTISTAWTGFEGGAITPWFSLLDLADDTPATEGDLGVATELNQRNGTIGFADPSDFGGGATPGDPRVTYSGSFSAGTYDVSVQIVNWGNFDFPGTVITLNGAALTPTSANATPASEDDEVWTFTVDLPASSALVFESTLTNGPVNGGRSNMGIDHVTIAFTPIPEPGSAALLGLCGIAAILRRRR